MSVEIQISSNFARYAGNQTVIEVAGKTLGECLDDLYRRYPELKTIFMDKEGKMRRAFNIYINGTNTYPIEMTRPVNDGDRVYIMPIVFGG